MVINQIFSFESVILHHIVTIQTITNKAIFYSLTFYEAPHPTIGPTLRTQLIWMKWFILYSGWWHKILTFSSKSQSSQKEHRKNWEYCPCHSLTVGHPHCHDFSISICQEQSTVALSRSQCLCLYLCLCLWFNNNLFRDLWSLQEGQKSLFKLFYHRQVI